MKGLLALLFTLALALALPITLGSCGSDNTDCKSACDKLSSCGLKSSGLSCDSACEQGGCADCVSQGSCSDIEAGACSNACPGVSFTKK